MSFQAMLNRLWRQLLENRAENWVNKVRMLHENRGRTVARLTGTGQIYSQRLLPDQEVRMDYKLRVVFLIKQEADFYLEEQVRDHQVIFSDNEIHTHQELAPAELDQEIRTNPAIELTPVPEAIRFDYDRRAAVQYAERWWNDANPAYHFFEDNDCTNFVSQCLRAGGAPMRGYPNRSTGWWYQENNWSFSWSVAHSLRWYLSGSTKGLRGFEVDAPEKLHPGDVICYDFQGDGRFDHNTIVVAKDQDNMPLVNAHTNNSRRRYWDYQDSMAWTPNCVYKFFRIGTDVL
ncbi:amidase domain-containing protein [Amphibacillus sediminis]|uniref:amidase domain-containing protein n=1 Tax=Amphibacillus sediminis TaxID=360185 RepID=UPI0008379F78|nr:amidase domain-containing protein [Amphibacillus sediminis]